jgi:type I restriction enzyme S subunit
MPRADWANIGNLKIPIPTLEQQTAITDYLDAEVSKVDSLVTAKEQWLELLAEKRQALITHAVTRGINPSAPLRDSGIPWLGQIPKHWRLVPLRFAVKFVSGATPDKGNADFWVGTIPWVSPKDMKRDEISDAEDHVSEEAILNSALRLVPVGSVLIVVRGMILAHSFPTAITTGPVTINQDMKALICYESLASRFLKAVFQGLSAWFVSSADQSAHGTKKLETETLGRFGIPLPPLDEQNAIVAHIAEETARLDALRVATEASIVLLKERRSALISAAVTGKLRVPAKSEVADSSATMV